MVVTANDQAEDFRPESMHRAQSLKRNRFRRAQQAKNVGEPEQSTKTPEENYDISAPGFGSTRRSLQAGPSDSGSHSRIAPHFMRLIHAVMMR